MEIELFNISDLALIKPNIFRDHRGYFIESFNQKKFTTLMGKEVDFVQDNESLSTYGTLRGIHFQKPPFEQAKLVRVIKGEVLDVVVDLRKDSPTLGHWKSFLLNEENKHQLFVPRGFGHGFLVTSKEAIFSYKVDNYYAPNHDSGIKWDDKTLNIDWTIDIKDLNLSEKDKNLQSFENYKANK